MKGILALGASACAMLVAPAVAAADWYVDQAAAAGGDGTSAKPFKTINEVKSVLKTGDTVNIADGVYQETVDFWHVPAGSGQRTTIQAAAGAHPIIDAGGQGDFIFQAGETPFMTFRGLTLRNGGSAFHFYKADDGEVIDCKTEAVSNAVDFYFSSRGLVTGSDLYGGVAGKGSDGTVLRGNLVHDSAAEGITLHDNSKNCKYVNNTVYDNHSVNIYIDSASNMLIDGNLVFMTGEPPSEMAGIQLADEAYSDVTAPVMTDITIVNNIIVNNDYGITFWEGNFPGQSALKNVLIANNTVINSKSAAITWDPGPHSNSVVRNNIFASQSGIGVILLVAKSTTGVVLDHNLWYMPHVPEPFNWGGGTAYDHAGWMATSQQGTADVLEDPKFAGAWSQTAANLMLAQDSPAIDKGTAITGLDHDFAGGARPTGAAFDLGAYEYGAKPADDAGTPPVPDSGTPGQDSGTPGQDSGNPQQDGAAGSGGSVQPGGDASTEAGNGAAPSEDSGCGCRTAPGAGGAHAGMVGMGLLMWIWRRRRRAQA